MTLPPRRHILPRMDILSAVVIGLAITVALLAVLRTVPKRRFLTILLLLGPLVVFSYRWSLYRQAQTEWIYGVAGGLILTLLWWVFWGRRLPPPDDSTIRVWTKEDPFE